MLPDRVSNPGPLTYESGALLIAQRGLATSLMKFRILASFITSHVSCLCSWARQNFPALLKTEQTLLHRIEKWVKFHYVPFSQVSSGRGNRGN